MRMRRFWRRDRRAARVGGGGDAGGEPGDSSRAAPDAGSTNGGSAPSPRLSTGGPAGAADGYLRVTATGGGGAGEPPRRVNVAPQSNRQLSTAGVNALSIGP